jgi:peptide/nickel transport system substrate-binding protein
MKRRSTTALAAVAVAALAITAGCSSSGSSTVAGNSNKGNTAGAPAFNEGITTTVNPSNAKSNGTITMDIRNTPDSLDGGNTYYAWVLDFSHLYELPMFVYKSCPGQCGLQLVPGLATDMGTTSDNGLTWTFHIQPDVKYENGQTVTASDVKYAIERTYDRSVMANGPTYYQALLTDPTYPGPYKDRAKNLMGLTAIDVPNATTLVFHLQSPFPDLPYVLAFPSSAPVPPAADTGANYQLHPLATGPYKFQNYSLNKQLTLVPNTEWNPATDPNAKQLVSKIVVNMNVNQADIDNRLIAGDIDLDVYGSGMATAGGAHVLSSPSLEANADDAINGFARFTYLDTQVAPMTNLHCREAVEYAVNKTAVQDAWGGAYEGGAIASTVMPPTVIGYQKFDYYDALTQPAGNDSAAKQQLSLCGKPNGFSASMAYRSDSPDETAAATAIQASLAQVGIKLTLRGYPTGNYYTDFAGVPAYMAKQGISMAMGGWGADWPNGYGFLDELSNGNSIASTGNANISMLNDPTINNLFKSSNTLSGAARTAVWAQVDEQIMKLAAIVPGVYQKALLYRNPDLTNVYVQTYYGMYNYAVLGLKS